LSSSLPFSGASHVQPSFVKLLCEVLSIFPEAHYNHYGDRGVVDLYIEQSTTYGGKEGIVLELKSEAAVRESTGANEIIRQFNRMREYFFKGSSHDPPESIIFELCFVPTEYNIRHIYENLDLYYSSVEQRLTDIDTRIDQIEHDNGSTFEYDNYRVLVTTRLPDANEINPIIYCTQNSLPPEEFDFEKFAEGGNRRIYNQFQPLFEEIASDYR
ncbi:hypothetical protein ACLI4R_18745, partial [Natrialbaceae archaeon A-chndr2]